MDGKTEELIFTQYLIEGAWFICVVQDTKGNIIKLMEEPLFESEVEFEADFEIEDAAQ
jgi:hypothetical protein